jgi:hypothetical protein
MNDLRTETLDAAEARASRRIGLVSLGVVTGSLVVAMAVAIAAGDGKEATDASADCRRSDRTLSATATSQHAKPETLLCASGKSLVQRLF